jgi:hypothetical protein
MKKSCKNCKHRDGCKIWYAIRLNTEMNELEEDASKYASDFCGMYKSEESLLKRAMEILKK